ncbi:MAG: hypothetical protein AABX29_01965 [Nanoarchaeota archaeon]
MKQGLREKVLISLGLVSLVSGCSSFSSANYSNQIIYQKYVDVLSKKAEELANNGNPDDLYEAGRIFMKVGRIERTENVAEALLQNKRAHALNLYDELQRWRNEHPEKK